MTSADNLAAEVAEVHGLTKKAAKEIIESTLDIIRIDLAMGKTINLGGFGKFAVKQVAARTGRNPQTGEAVQIPAKRKASFLPAAQLKAALNG